MNKGTLYGIGVGPGNPDWITLEAVKTLGKCLHVFAPRAKDKSDSLALEIAKAHLSPNAQIHELTFPMSKDKEVLNKAWSHAAEVITEVLEKGEDACFLTIGDCMLYSTFIYLKREMELLSQNVKCIPGIPAFVAAASLTGTPLGEGKHPLTIVPVSRDLEMVQKALDTEGTVILMKVAAKLPEVLPVLKENRALERTVLVARAGLPDEKITHFKDLKDEDELPSAYLSIGLVEAPKHQQNSLFDN